MKSLFISRQFYTFSHVLKNFLETGRKTLLIDIIYMFVYVFITVRG